MAHFGKACGDLRRKFRIALRVARGAEAQGDAAFAFVGDFCDALDGNAGGGIIFAGGLRVLLLWEA